MKKSILYLCLVLLASCKTASYVHDLDSTPYNIDYRQGKWLINNIEAPLTIKERVTKIAYEGFYKNLGDQVKKVEDLPNISLSYIPLQPNKIVLEQAKKDSKFDYLINIKCMSSKDEISELKMSRIRGKKRNVAEAVLEVYDLNTLEIIYSRKVTGKVTIKNEDDSDTAFSFVKGTNGIMISSLKRIMKRI